ncbi:MAG: prepilin-type N-terminal cleavage/methylation domain-containing protein [Chlamydiota bacterium]|nr:prepilin-type N-terminal cleavage/methylation domain-containing protein [Chlamydiota bacterium]
MKFNNDKYSRNLFKSLRRRQRLGFTFIELIVVIIIIGLLATVAVMPINIGARAYSTARKLMQAHELGRCALWPMERDLRLMRKSALQVADVSNISYRDVYQENITFLLSGTQILRNGRILSEFISQLSFSYYDIDNNVLGPLPLSAANRAMVYCININLTVNFGGETYVFKQKVFPRNLK